MKFVIIFVIAGALSSCARQFRYSGGETGRVAGYFQMNEAEVSRIYADSGFSWPAAIRRLIEEKTLSSGPARDDMTSRFDEETEKIMRECRLE